MIRISVFSCWACLIWLNAACQPLEPANDYVFPEHEQQLFVIVNHVANAPSVPTSSGRHEFVFPPNGVLVCNIDAFSISPDDRFYIDKAGERQPFDPKNQSLNAIKVCAYSSSHNSGYNEAYYRKKFGLPPSLNPSPGIKSFDFYFFNVSRDCNASTVGQDEWLQQIYKFLEEGDYKSSLPAE